MGDNDGKSDLELRVLENILDRSERATDRQIEGVRTTVNRAAELTKINLIYVGLLLTILSIISQSSGFELSNNIRIALSITGIGVVLSVVSVALSIKVHIGTTVSYFSFPEQTIAESYFQDAISRTGEVLQRNDAVITQKKMEIRRALSSMLGGLSLSGAGVIFLIANVPAEIQIIIILILGPGIGYFIRRILAGEFDIEPPEEIT